MNEVKQVTKDGAPVCPHCGCTELNLKRVGKVVGNPFTKLKWQEIHYSCPKCNGIATHIIPVKD